MNAHLIYKGFYYTEAHQIKKNFDPMLLILKITHRINKTLFSLHHLNEFA